MTAFISTLSRDLACAAAAAVITMVVAVSIFQSTSAPSFGQALTVATAVAAPAGHQA